MFSTSLAEQFWLSQTISIICFSNSPKDVDFILHIVAGTWSPYNFKFPGGYSTRNVSIVDVQYCISGEIFLICLIGYYVFHFDLAFKESFILNRVQKNLVF